MNTTSSLCLRLPLLQSIFSDDHTESKALLQQKTFEGLISSHESSRLYDFNNIARSSIQHGYTLVKFLELSTEDIIIFGCVWTISLCMH